MKMDRLEVNGLTFVKSLLLLCLNETRPLFSPRLSTATRVTKYFPLVALEKKCLNIMWRELRDIRNTLFVENKSTDYLAKSNVFEGSTFLLGYIIIKNKYGNYIFRYSNKRRSSQWDIEKEMHDEDVERRDKNKTNQRLGRSFFFVPATIDFRLEVTKQTDWTNLKRNARHQSRVTSFLCIFFVLFFILIFWFDTKKKIGKRIERNYVVVLRHDALATAVFNRFVQTRLCEIRRIVYGI